MVSTDVVDIAHIRVLHNYIVNLVSVQTGDVLSQKNASVRPALSHAG